MSSRANPDRPWNWYSDEDSGGGVLGALGTHAFDMIHWLIGPTHSLSAINSTSIKERKYIAENTDQIYFVKAALATSYLVGKKDKIAADQFAVDAMRSELNEILYL